jgi:hypothetical protein
MAQRLPKELRFKIEQARRLRACTLDKITDARLIDFLHDLEAELASYKK